MKNAVKSWVPGLLAVCVLLCGTIFAADQNVVKVHRYRSKRAMEDSRFDDAEREFRAWKKIADNEELLVEASLGIIKALLLQQEYQKALREIEAVPNDYKKLPGTNGNLGEELQRENILKLAYWKGRVLLAQGKSNDAVQALKPVLKIKDSRLRAMARFYTGRAYLAMDKLDKAQAEFDRLATGDPQTEASQAGHLGLLEVLARQKKWDEFDLKYQEWDVYAVGTWDLAMDMLRVRALLKRERPVEALTLYRNEYLDVPPERLKPYERHHLKDPAYYTLIRLIGQRLTEAKEYRLVREKLYVDLQPRLEFDSQQQQILADMAVSAAKSMRDAMKKGNEKEIDTWRFLAGSDFQRFLKNYPQSPSAARVLYVQGQFYLDLKNEKEALQNFVQAYEHKQAPPTVRYEAAVQLATHNREKEKMDDALKWFQNAAEQNVAKPLQAEAQYRRGEIYDELNLHKNAAKVFQQIVEGYPDLPIANKALAGQGKAAFKSGDYRNAEKILKRFLLEAPRPHPMRPETLYRLGVVQRHNEQWSESEQTLLDFVKQYPANDLAPMALLEAGETVRVAGLERKVVGYATRVISEYPSSPQVARALYNRIYYGLFLDLDQNEKRAFEDMERFFAKDRTLAKDNPEMAAQILTWFARRYFMQGDYDRAEAFYLRVVKEFSESRIAPEARYEAAKSVYLKAIREKTNNFSRSIQYLNQLQANGSGTKDLRVLSQAFLLHGDILAVKSDYAEAESLFQKCADLAKNRSLNLYYNSLARVGDMRYARVGSTKEAARKDELLVGAEKCYTEIIDQFNFHTSMMVKAKYHRGLVRQLQRNETGAIEDFRSVFEGYEQLRTQNRTIDPYYPQKAGVTLAEHYERAEQLMKAINVYERLASMNVPLSNWARKRADGLKARLAKAKTVEETEGRGDTPAQSPPAPEPAPPAPADE